MEMYNSEGSRGEMCGNGIRCVAKYLIEHGVAGGPQLRIETDAGVKTLDCKLESGKVTSVRVDMGTPILKASMIPTTIQADRVIDHPLGVAGEEFLVTCVSMGNPHAVVFVRDLHKIDLVALGPKFEHASPFPRKTNAHFARVDDRRRVTVRHWERGSGATRACGSGACAVGVAGALTGRTERRITACLPGGELEVEWADNDHVYMTGPAVEVFSGDWPQSVP
jgi:diaminopimelate epimerase